MNVRLFSDINRKAKQSITEKLTFNHFIGRSHLIATKLFDLNPSGIQEACQLVSLTKPSGNDKTFGN